MTNITGTVKVQSMGIIMPGISSCKDIGIYCNTGKLTNFSKVKYLPVISGISKRDAGRMAHITNLALNAAEEAFSNLNQPPHNGAIFIGLTHGSTSLLCEFHDYLFDFGPDMASPNAFSNGVTNAPFGALSKYLNLTQGGSTFVGYENCGMEVLNYAAFSLQNNIYSFCLAGAAEEYSPLIEEVYLQCSRFENIKKEQAIPQSIRNLLIEKRRYYTEGSVFLALSSEHTQYETENNRICYYKPVENIHKINIDVDLIISGMYGRSQDTAEFDIIKALSDRQNIKPDLLFSKLLFGESFAVGALISSSLAWDILVNSSTYTCYKFENKKKSLKLKKTESQNIKTILVISADRCNKVSAGIFSKSFMK
ncbi:MAG: hypothetical protein PVI26_03095 [Chitinispirillia bacterium]|jgi:hypothetical protein